MFILEVIKMLVKTSSEGSVRLSKRGGRINP